MHFLEKLTLLLSITKGHSVQPGYRVACVVLLCLLTVNAFGQLQEVPLRRGGTPPSPRVRRSTANARIMATEPLQLPFFEDFSGADALGGYNRPDTTQWMDSSGVNINNTYPINHPSMYVATFDGLQANGVPYNFTSPTAEGLTDTLQSQSIDLSAYQVADSLYLSFYWEARGRGEQPDLQDSLVVTFLDASGNWNIVWSQLGQTIDPTTGRIVNLNDSVFVPVRIPLDSAKYMHAGFQFKFMAYGRQSGAFDVWNVDYIYLNKNRNFGRYVVSEDVQPGQDSTGPYPNDVACQNPVTSFLKRYRAMPYWQYFYRNPATETADTIWTSINNLFNNATFTSFRISVQDTLSKQVFQSCDLPPQQGLPPCGQTAAGIASLSSQAKGFVPFPLPASTPQQPMVLKTTFNFNITGEYLPQVNLGSNNAISGYTVLDNYYAYDDGTAESGGGINQTLGQVAVQYLLNKPDTLVAIQTYIAQDNVNQDGQSLVLRVYDNKNGLPNNKLYENVVPIQYSATLNQFQTDTLKALINTAQGQKYLPITLVVTDTFYVSWQQTTTDLIPLGLDKNYDSGDKIFYTLGAGPWMSNLSQTTPLHGSFMIRPLMGPSLPPVVTGVEPTPPPVPALPPLQVYPNPTTGMLTWSDASFYWVQVYDLSGKLMLTQQVQNQSTPQLDMGSFSNGLYILHFSNGQRTEIRKIVLAK